MAIRDGLIAAALVTGPLWAQALWKRIRRLATRALSGRGDERGSSRRRSFSGSEVGRVQRRWWFMAPVLIAIVALATGARPGRWLDTALNASGCLGILEEHESPVQSVAFSPDGAFLASGSGDGTARSPIGRCATRSGLRRAREREATHTTSPSRPTAQNWPLAYRMGRCGCGVSTTTSAARRPRCCTRCEERRAGSAAWPSRQMGRHWLLAREVDRCTYGELATEHCCAP